MTKALVVYGLGIGCHNEAADAYRQAGAEADITHLNCLLENKDNLIKDYQIINIAGGFMHGDILGAGMCAANQMEHATFEGQKFQDLLWEFSESGNVVYGQCNGFQLLVKSGLLPALNDEYLKPVLTLTHNDCGAYRVSYVPHKLAREHFAFDGLGEEVINLWCRHGEGRVTFRTESSSVSEEQAETYRKEVLAKHTLLCYVDSSGKPTEDFPNNPNGSEDGIAGLVSSNSRIFGHMAHPEVSIYASRNPNWFREKAAKNQQSEPVGLTIFKNIVSYFS